jgi:hypothetical protein
MKCIIDGDVALARPLEGPLSAQVGAFAQWGRHQGYALASRHRQVLLAAAFSLSANGQMRPLPNV